MFNERSPGLALRSEGRNSFCRHRTLPGIRRGSNGGKNGQLEAILPIQRMDIGESDSPEGESPEVTGSF